MGGGERYPLELARAIAALTECQLITFGPLGATWREENGLLVRTLPVQRYLRGHPANPVSFALPAALEGASLVHVHQMRTLPAKTAAVAARLRGLPAVVSDEGMPGSDWGGLLQRLFAAFLLVSAFSARVVKAPSARTRVIYGGVDTARFRPQPGEERRGVLFVGRLTAHKGVDRLIEALPEGATLTVAGSEGHDPRPPENGYPRYLRQLAAGKDVRFLGPVADADLPALYRRAQVCVLPSVERTCYGKPVAVSELLGLVLLEAMASATPVVASRLGGLPEVVTDGVTGLLVPPGDVPALREALAYLLADDRRARQLGEAGRAAVEERFTWPLVAERCLATYQRLLAGVGTG